MSDRKKPREGSQGEPNVAALLTWFVPGAGHLYLGRPVFALGAFAVVQGLYLLGLWLSDGLVFEYLQEELRSRLAPALTPEAGNLGALLYQLRAYPYLEEPVPWPPYIKLGGMLTALSGVANMCLMVRAYTDARFKPETLAAAPSALRAIFLGWLVPGLGHIVTGRRARGVMVFSMLVGLFALGTALADGSNLDRERHFYYWAGQFMLGAPALVTELMHGYPRVTGDIPYVDGGVVIASLAGLLNILALLDVYTGVEAAVEEQEEAERRAAREARALAAGTSQRGPEETEVGATA